MKSKNGVKKYREDIEILLVIPRDELEDAEDMAEESGFSSVQDLMESKYKTALRTYRRMQSKKEG